MEMEIVLIAAITTAGMLYSSMSDSMLPFALEPFATALAFVFIGEIIKAHESTLLNRIDKVWLIAVLLVVEAVMAMLNGSVDMRSARYNHCILYLINAIIGTLAYWGIARKVSLLTDTIPRGMVQKVSSLGRNAMGYVCLNQLFITIYGSIYKAIPLHGMIAKVISKTVTFAAVMVTISCITQIIIKSRFKFILGRRQ